MHRDHSVLLKQAADKYLAYNKKHFSDDREMMEWVFKDYEDLISIAKSIGLNESKSAILKAMWSLDTAVRDVIPDEVYKHYYE